MKGQLNEKTSRETNASVDARKDKVIARVKNILGEI